MRDWYPVLPLSLLLAASVSRPMAAQDAPSMPARIALVDARSGEPVREALVRFDPVTGGAGAEQLLVEGVTRSLRVPATGTYRVRVRQPGRSWWSSEVVSLPAPRPSTLTLRVEATQTQLETTGASTACTPSPDPLSTLGQALELVRSTVHLVRAVEDAGLAPRFVRRSVRVGAAPAVDEREWRTEFGRASALGGGRDSVALLDLTGLLRADVERTHCFTLARGTGARAGVLGLSFTPAPGGAATVGGTAWIDATTREVRAIELRAPDGLTGEVQLGVRDNGVRTVSGWQLTRGTGATMVEERADVRAATAGEALALGARVGTVEGLVYDSLRGAPLPEATVRVTTIGRTVYADDAGWFTLDLLPVGTHAIE
nr:carboxypeptidase-like regulatory domain-containing protein [Gemmatimonadaceae bacterium]